MIAGGTTPMAGPLRLSILALAAFAASARAAGPETLDLSGLAALAETRAADRSAPPRARAAWRRVKGVLAGSEGAPLHANLRRLARAARFVRGPIGEEVEFTDLLDEAADAARAAVQPLADVAEGEIDAVAPAGRP